MKREGLGGLVIAEDPPAWGGDVRTTRGACARVRPHVAETPFLLFLIAALYPTASAGRGPPRARR